MHFWDRALIRFGQPDVGQPDARDSCRQALVRAGYPQAGRRSPFHFSHLANPAGDRRAAEQAFRALLAADPDDREGLEGLAFLLQLTGRGHEALPYRRRLLVQHARQLGVVPDAQEDTADYLLSAETGDASPTHTPPEYVRRLFDRYASNFEDHLRDRLHYRVPELLLDQFVAHMPDTTRTLDILDIGCGTGLAGQVFEPLTRRLDGVDLSPKMLARARQRGIYDRLHEGELVSVLRRCPARYDAVTAADVLCYFGDLQPLFDVVSTVLRRQGYLLLSVEAGEGADYRLRASGRYQHTAAYLRRCAQNAGFAILSLVRAPLREQHGQPVAGLLGVMQHT